MPTRLASCPTLPFAQQQLLLQVGALELLARLAQAAAPAGPASPAAIGRRLHRELALDFLQADLFRATVDQQPMHRCMSSRTWSGQG